MSVRPAAGQEDSKVVVVKGQPHGQPVPVGPNEKVGAVTVVRLPSGPVAVVRKDIMPSKPDFNIITPDDVSHPFKNGPSAASGITQSHEVQVANDAVNGDRYVVKTKYKEGAREVGSASESFPQGSRYVPDPPQPAGLTYITPDETPVSAAEEALVLAALNMPDMPGTQVYRVPSGNLLFMRPGMPQPTIVSIRGGAPKGDMNCDGAVDNFDIDPFVEALLMPAQYLAENPGCDVQNGDIDEDGDLTNFDIDPFVGCVLTGGC